MTFKYVAFCMSVLLLIAGCASTKAHRQPIITGKIARPAHIWVVDFAASADEIPANSTLVGYYGTKDMAQTKEDIATGRKLGALIATELVKKIRDMEMPAKHMGPGSTPAINDIIIRGYIVSFDEGSAAKRVTIGLGAGTSELKVAVEGFQVTAQGPRLLGFGTTDATGSKTPGGAVGAAAWIATANPAGLIVSSGMKVYGEVSGSGKVEGRAVQTAGEIADTLKKRFQEQGWVR